MCSSGLEGAQVPLALWVGKMFPTSRSLRTAVTLGLLLATSTLASYAPYASGPQRANESMLCKTVTVGSLYNTWYVHLNTTIILPYISLY